MEATDDTVKFPMRTRALPRGDDEERMSRDILNIQRMFKIL